MIKTKQSSLALNIPDSSKPRIIMVGGGFGGINFLKKINTKLFQVVVFDRYNYHTFQPLLYQVATAGLEPDSIAGPLRKIINKKHNVYFRMLKVNRIDTEKHIVFTEAGELTFDYLVIATGAKMNYFNKPDIAKHAFPIKQITHALDLRSHIFQQFEKMEIITEKKRFDKYSTFAVVGAGPTGVEICGALSELKNHALPKDYPDLDIKNMKIYLIEGLDRVLPSMSKKSSKKAQKYLEKLGIEIILNCKTQSYDGNTIKLSNNKEIDVGTLIWAAGVKGNLINGLSAKSISNGKIWVNRECRVYKDPNDQSVYSNIFAIGDVAHMEHENYPKGLPGLAQVAIQQGKHLAKSLSRIMKKKKSEKFYYKNKGVLATVGRNKAVADLPGNITLSGISGWIIWMMVHLLFLIGFRNKTVVFANWLWNYFTYDRGIRLILRPSSKKKDRMSREMESEMNETENINF
ncbi:MAG TPA: FAD-dependent oxidoreductase [Bacteroidales bacterium]|nr:FAD-dependent oxidoreductase [Bacteroidales bacterium]